MIQPLDWFVLFATLALLGGYGLWRARGASSTSQYLLAGRTMPWYAIALSIMATQASAVTFISTTGLGYTDGMRFVQFYFGLPLAMILISMTAVPIFRKSGVYTAYEYLEKRFDAKTRALVSVVFLIQRSLSAGVTLYASAVVLSVIIGWNDTATTVLMGLLVVLFTVTGGIKAITWTDTLQMVIVTLGLLTALGTALWLMPRGVGFLDALALAGAVGKVNPVTVNIDLNDRYNLFSGLIGGMFLALAYFGCDQSQVQRYLTGRSMAQSRLSLIFNALAKIPMQFSILTIGVVVFAFYLFAAPPALFKAPTLERLQGDAGFQAIEQRYAVALADRKAAAEGFLAKRDEASAARFRESHQASEAVRKEAIAKAAAVEGKGFSDTNYIFLNFVTRYVPVGLVGLVLAAIFGAAMTAISGEINSLATVTVIDVYKRFWRREADDRETLRASQAATAFWGLAAVGTASFAKGLGALIEAVNLLGSLFYGGILGMFVLAFYFHKVRATAAFLSLLVAEAVLFGCFFFTKIAFLWYNVIGCAVVIGAALLLQNLLPKRATG
jgi:Na+/proline symporter